MPAICSSRRWRAANCIASARPRWTNTASTSKRMRRWSGASRRSWSDEPSVEATIAILRGLQEKYEVHHGVDITDPAIVAAAELSHRYITDRFLPDKAIDLIDEAASKIKIEIDSKPEVMDRLDRRLIQLKIEREAVQEGKGRGFAKAPGLDRGRNRASWSASTPTWKKSGRRKRPRCRAASTSRKKSKRCGCRWKKPSARAIGKRCPNCSTASCRNWKRN